MIIALGGFSLFAIIVLISFVAVEVARTFTPENIGKVGGEIVRSYNETVRGDGPLHD